MDDQIDYIDLIHTLRDESNIETYEERLKKREFEFMKLQWSEDLKEIYKSPLEIHHKCSVICQKTGKIICLNLNDCIYGCTISGWLHTCKQDEDCKYKFRGSDKMLLCVLSGAIVSVYVDSTPKFSNNTYFNFQRKKKTENRNTVDDLGDYSMAGYDEQNDDIVEDMDICNINEECVPIYSEAMNSTIKIKKRVNTKSEIMDYELEDSNVTKSHRQIHVKRANKEIKLKDCEIKFNKILSDLLYDYTKKEEINKELCNKAVKKALESLKKYAKQCRNNNVIISRITMDNYWELELNKFVKTMFNTTPVPEPYRKYYLTLCDKVYEIIDLIYEKGNQIRKKKINAKQFVIGLLKLQQNGLELDIPFGNNGVSQKLLILSKDTYLESIFPDVSNLSYLNNIEYQYEMGDITDGQSLLQNSFNLGITHYEKDRKNNEIIKLALVCQKLRNALKIELDAMQ